MTFSAGFKFHITTNSIHVEPKLSSINHSIDEIPSICTFTEDLKKLFLHIIGPDILHAYAAHSLAMSDDAVAPTASAAESVEQPPNRADEAAAESKTEVAEHVSNGTEETNGATEADSSVINEEKAHGGDGDAGELSHSACYGS